MVLASVTAIPAQINPETHHIHPPVLSRAYLTPNTPFPTYNKYTKFKNAKKKLPTANPKNPQAPTAARPPLLLETALLIPMVVPRVPCPELAILRFLRAVLHNSALLLLHQYAHVCGEGYWIPADVLQLPGQGQSGGCLLVGRKQGGIRHPDEC